MPTDFHAVIAKLKERAATCAQSWFWLPSLGTQILKIYMDLTVLGSILPLAFTRPDSSALWITDMPLKEQGLN